jgi:adenylate cyclase class 2
MKVREELEIEVKDAALVLRLLERLDLQVCFRYQKYREEYVRGDVILTIDDTPVGTYVELEGDEQGITEIAQAMGRTMADYVLESYRDLFATARAQRKLTGTDMVFDPQP